MTDTKLDTLPGNEKTLADKAKDAAATGKEKVTSAASATVAAAKDHPYAAAGIAAGVAAAVAGGAFAAAKLAGGDTKPAGRTKTTKK